MNARFGNFAEARGSTILRTNGGQGMDKARAKDFADKAEKLIKWGAELLEELRLHATAGEIDKVERTFVTVISFFDSLHEALADCAKKLDQSQWREQLNAFRDADPLLRYLWKARNSETHDALIKWRPGMKQVEVRIVDPKKVDQAIGFARMLGEPAAMEKLYRVLYEADSTEALKVKLGSGFVPSADIQAKVGVEVILSLESLALDAFSIGRGKEHVDAPRSHDGKTLPPSAFEAVRTAMRYYQARFDELKAHFV